MNLLPCPFCNGSAELDTQQAYVKFRGGIGHRVTVYCTQCPADLGMCLEDAQISLDDDTACAALAEDVIERWNRRAASAQAPAQAPEPESQYSKGWADGWRAGRSLDAQAPVALPVAWHSITANDERSHVWWGSKRPTGSGKWEPLYATPQEAPVALPEPVDTGVGEWCMPGDVGRERGRVWLLRFDDADRGDCIYRDEAEARRAFALAEHNGWNCYLFASAPRATLQGVDADRREGMESVRAEFEAWFLNYCGQGPKDAVFDEASPHWLERTEDGEYEWVRVRDAWTGWKGRAAYDAARVEPS